jgi:MFS family permease
VYPAPVSEPAVSGLPTRRYARYVLGMLLGVYTLNFVDRIILGILVPPIKQELHLTDTELGLLGGTAFAIFYTALGLLIGRLADRLNRVWIIGLSLALWSAFSAACGLAQSFLQLFICRLGVGIGEAGGVAPAYSLICDFFPGNVRGRALSTYSLGIPLGSAAGVLFGGLVAAEVNWRFAFLSVGALGLLLAPWFARSIREPVRGGLEEPASAPGPSASCSTPPQGLFVKLSFWSLALGGAMCSLIGYGMIFWLPSFFVRSYYLTLRQVSWYVAGLNLIGGGIGIWMGGWLSDRLGSSHRAAFALVPAVACMLCMPCYAFGVSTPSSHWAPLLFLLPSALSLVWLAPTICAIQHLVRAESRAFASASFLFVNNLIGLGLGTLTIGWLSDHFAVRYGADSLRHAILWGTGFYLLAAALFLIAASRLSREWQR